MRVEVGWCVAVRDATVVTGSDRTPVGRLRAGERYRVVAVHEGWAELPGPQGSPSAFVELDALRAEGRPTTAATTTTRRTGPPGRRWLAPLAAATALAGLGAWFWATDDRESQATVAATPNTQPAEQSGGAPTPADATAVPEPTAATASAVTPEPTSAEPAELGRIVGSIDVGGSIQDAIAVGPELWVLVEAGPDSHLSILDSASLTELDRIPVGDIIAHRLLGVGNDRVVFSQNGSLIRGYDVAERRELAVEFVTSDALYPLEDGSVLTFFTNSFETVVRRLDPTSLTVTEELARFDRRSQQATMVTGRLWLCDSTGIVVVDPVGGPSVTTIELPVGDCGLVPAAGTVLLHNDSTGWFVDAATLEVIATSELDGRAWVGSPVRGEFWGRNADSTAFVVVDPGGVVAAVPVEGLTLASALVPAGEVFSVAVEAGRTAIDLGSHEVIGTFDTPVRRSLAFHDGVLWLGNDEGTVVAFDASTGVVAARLQLSHPATAATVVAGRLWIYDDPVAGESPTITAVER